MSHSLFIQLGMVVVAGIITVMYIMPTMEEIRTVQDKIAVYEKEIENVTSVNQKLQASVSQVQSVSPDNKQALDRYLPNQFDVVSVMKEINTILTGLNLEPTALEFTGGGSGESNNSNSEAVATSGSFDSATHALVPYTFTFSVDLEYDELKQLLSTIETNDYLLEINKLEVAPAEDDDLTATFEVSRYEIAQKAMEVISDEEFYEDEI